MWTIIYETKKDGEVIEQGFEGTSAHDIDHALQEANTIIDLDNCDEVLVRIVKAEY